MRIITKFTLLYLVLLFITLAVGGVVTYQSVKQEVKTETDYSLREETRIIAQSISEGKPIDALENIKVQIHILPENTQEDASRSHIQATTNIIIVFLSLNVRAIL